jgi:GGDEF domain-containing protein
VQELEDACEGAIDRPFKLGSTVVRLQGSVGVVVAGYGDTPDSLLARADRSMYLVKRERRLARDAGR